MGSPTLRRGYIERALTRRRPIPPSPRPEPWKWKRRRRRDRLLPSLLPSRPRVPGSALARRRSGRRLRARPRRGHLRPRVRRSDEGRHRVRVRSDRSREHRRGIREARPGSRRLHGPGHAVRRRVPRSTAALVLEPAGQGDPRPPRPPARGAPRVRVGLRRAGRRGAEGRVAPPRRPLAPESRVALSPDGIGPSVPRRRRRRPRGGRPPGRIGRTSPSASART